MLANRLVTVLLATSTLVLLSSTQALGGTKLYDGAWIAESFGNDKAGIGTEASQYFSVLGIPQGINCHPNAPLCSIDSTPVTTTGTPDNPGANGMAWHPLGPGCRPLITNNVGNGTNTETPRPPRGGTLTPGGLACGHTMNHGPCNKRPPLYRNLAFFTAGGAASNASCQAEDTVGLLHATKYLAPGDPQRGIAMKGNPVSGTGNATTTGGTAFKFPAAAPSPGQGMHRTTIGSFTGEEPYLYSYTYANLRNDAGSFGVGKGFFAVSAAPTTLQFHNKVGGTYVATAKVTRGKNTFGGVMKLLGSYTTKVCYLYGGGCGLGYGTWNYEDIGAAGYKDFKSPGSKVVTRSYTTNHTFTYYNTALGTIAKYDIYAQRFPWTTGTVTVIATQRGNHKTFEQRKGFDNRVDGVGTIQLVSPILTQWLAHAASGPQLETGGIAVLRISFVPEPGVLIGLVAGLSLLGVLNRFRP